MVLGKQEGPIALAVGACGGCVDIFTLLYLFPPSPLSQGLSGGAMVLGKLSVPRRPTNLDYNRARASCACSRYARGVWTFLFLSVLSSFSPTLGDDPI